MFFFCQQVVKEIIITQHANPKKFVIIGLKRKEIMNKNNNVRKFLMFNTNPNFKILRQNNY
jgi:hypothetical protein